MNKAIALSKSAFTAASARGEKIAQGVVVVALAASLIFAGQPFPF